MIFNWKGKGGLKPCMIMYSGNIHNMSLVPDTFKTFFSNPPKMAIFGLNWGESKWPGHFCSKVLNFFASKIGVKLPPGKKVPWHRRWAALSRWSNCHFFQKMHFSGRKMHFFKKFILYKNVQWPKIQFFSMFKIFFCYLKNKLIFFTELNLIIGMLCRQYW